MKSRQIIYVTLIVNLVLGNFLLPLGRGKYETLSGMISAHLLTSLVAIGLLLYLFKKIKQTSAKLKVIIFPIIISGLVPLLTIYLLFGGMGLISGDIKALVAAIPLAVIAALVSWWLWVPLGLLNSVFYFSYFKALQKCS